MSRILGFLSHYRDYADTPEERERWEDAIKLVEAELRPERAERETREVYVLSKVLPTDLASYHPYSDEELEEGARRLGLRALGVAANG